MPGKSVAPAALAFTGSKSTNHALNTARANPSSSDPSDGSARSCRPTGAEDGGNGPLRSHFGKRDRKSVLVSKTEVCRPYPSMPLDPASD